MQADFNPLRDPTPEVLQHPSDQLDPPRGDGRPHPQLHGSRHQGAREAKERASRLQRRRVRCEAVHLPRHDWDCHRTAESYGQGWFEGVN